MALEIELNVFGLPTPIGILAVNDLGLLGMKFQTALGGARNSYTPISESRTKTGARPPFAVPIHQNVFASSDTIGKMLSEGLHSKPMSELVITDAPLAHSNAFAASSPSAC